MQYEKSDVTPKRLMDAEEVAKETGFAKSTALKLIQKLNNELKKKGFIIVHGRINRKYFYERFCYGETCE